MDQVNTKCLFFLDVGRMPAASRENIQFHMVSYCSAIKICRLVLVKYQDSISKQAINTKQPYLNGNRHVVNITNLTWSLPVKTGSIPVFHHRVGYISAGQAGNTQQTSRKLCRTSWLHFSLIFTTRGLSADEICDYVRRVSLHNTPFGIWHLTDYIWQRFKNRSWKHTLKRRELLKKGPEPKRSDRNRGWRGGGTITVMIQERAHDQHLSHKLRREGYC